MLKRIGGWIVVILATLFFLLVIATIVVTWIGERAIVNTSDSLLMSAEDYLGLSINGLQEVDSALAGAQAKVDGITESAQEIAEGGDSPLAVALQKTVADEIVPALTRVKSTVTGIVTALNGLNATLETLNRLPGNNMPTFTAELDEVEGKLQGISDGLAGLEQNIVESDGTRVISATTRLSENIVDVRTRLEESTQKVTDIQQRIETLRQQLPWYLRVAGIVLSFVLVFMAWGQWLLMGKSWGWARGR